jgi:hypothetical protein
MLLCRRLHHQSSRHSHDPSSYFFSDFQKGKKKTKLLMFFSCRHNTTALLLQEGKHNEGRNTLACRSSFSSLHFRTKPKQRGRNRSTYRSTPKHRAQQRVRIVIANLR